MAKKKVTDSHVSNTDTYREQMKARADAELQAKLDMVREESKPSYGRAHRKIGEMVCDTGIKTGYRNATASYVLRLDSTSGEFIAEHGDRWFISKSRDALKARMDQIARVTVDLKWTRYLKVEYKAHTYYRDNWYSTTTLDIDDERKKDRPILGIELKWTIVEYSDAIHLPGDSDARYMFREVEDGEPSSDQESKKEMDSGLVVYTKEREQLLQQIREGLTQLDAKMVTLLSGTPEQVGKQLDTMKGPLLLAAPKKEKKS